MTRNPSRNPSRLDAHTRPMTTKLSLDELEACAKERSGADLIAIARRVKRTGGCARPIRLKSSGPDSLSKGEPDGVLLVACKSRRETRCPPCANTYRGDARQLVRAGIEGGKGVPESVSSHSAVFLTLTAPSFGAVHHFANGLCNAGPPGNCRHGRSRHCLSRHEGNDDFGEQVRVDPLAPGDVKGIASYLAKYLTKEASGNGALDHRLREGEVEYLDLPDHLCKIVETAWSLGADPDLGRLRRWAPALGYTGHLMTKSRRYSTTFLRFRAALGMVARRGRRVGGCRAGSPVALDL